MRWFCFALAVTGSVGFALAASAQTSNARLAQQQVTDICLTNSCSDPGAKPPGSDAATSVLGQTIDRLHLLSASSDQIVAALRGEAERNPRAAELYESFLTDEPGASFSTSMGFIPTTSTRQAFIVRRGANGSVASLGRGKEGWSPDVP